MVSVLRIKPLVGVIPTNTLAPRVTIMSKMLNEMTLPELQIALVEAVEDGWADHIDSVRREITLMTIMMNGRHVGGRPLTAAGAAIAARAEADTARADARHARAATTANARHYARAAAEAATRAAEAARAATLYAATRAAEAEAEATADADTRAARAATYAHEATQAADDAALAAASSG
jgi:hypothetical protein